MVKHRSGTRWPNSQEIRWRYVMFDLKTKVSSFPRFGLKTGGFGFLS
jgi:hypothetical protein